MFAGASIDKRDSADSLSEGMKKLRQKLLESDKVDNYITKEDIYFLVRQRLQNFYLAIVLADLKDGKQKMVEV